MRSSGLANLGGGGSLASGFKIPEVLRTEIPDIMATNDATVARIGEDLKMESAPMQLSTKPANKRGHDVIGASQKAGLPKEK